MKLDLFAPFRRKDEEKIRLMKQRHKITTYEAKKSIQQINSVLTNGFAIKIYHAHGGDKHGNT